jgi:outer membrane protein TolC
MAGWSRWKKAARRYAAGFACGAVTLGAGCRSEDTTTEASLPHARSAALYPGLPPTITQPVSPAAAQRIAFKDGVGIVRTANVATASLGSQQVRTVAGVEDRERKVRHAAVGSAPVVAAGPAEAETIDLTVALRLAGVDNPTINLAREQVREALADLLGARSLLLPTVNVGGNYHLHNGILQSSSGGLRNLNSQSLYLGAGAAAVGSGSAAFPGVRLFAHLGDAVYEPLAARQRVSARRSDAQAVQNHTLLEVSVAYLDLVEAEARLEILRQGETDVDEVVRVTKSFADRGQGRQGDADRTAARAELLRQELRQAEGEVAVTSARLCELLNLDPSMRLRTPGGAILPVRLIPEDTNLEMLVTEGVRNRPELVARSAEILEAQLRVRQEQVRPWVPLVSVGYSGGAFGGGSNLATSDFGPMKGRSDFDVYAVWTVQNMGFGNRARVRRADGVVGQSIASYDRELNQVRREVSEALAQARAAARQMELSTASVANATQGFKLETERIQMGQGRPIEVLDSFNQLLTARQELVRAVIEFNTAQFRLYVAVGSSPPSVPVVGPEVVPPMVPPKK